MADANPPEAPRVISLALAGKGNFEQRRGTLVRSCWYLIEACFINSRFFPSSAFKVWLLRCFGAKIGPSCRMPHAFRVKFPWNLEIGSNCWIGEDVWLYNQERIVIGSDVCISQSTFLTTGSHDMRHDMSLKVRPILIEDGVWIASGCVIQMGSRIGQSAVIAPLSVVHGEIAAEKVYGGNPLRELAMRFAYDREDRTVRESKG